jgi:uncharacterized membrane protein (DUF485 family)
MEGFAWLIWYVLPVFVIGFSPGANADGVRWGFLFDRVVLTFVLVAVLIRGVWSAKQGDGYKGALVDA